jgi:membrane fusion protein (multidrug efflux system)
MSTVSTPSTSSTTPTRRRTRQLTALALVVGLAGVSYAAYWFAHGRYFVETDDAYTAVEVAQVTPEVGGTIQNVLVKDTQAVHKGDLLVQIDPTDAKLALAQAEANLQSAERHVRGLMATDGRLSAMIAARDADAKRAAAQLLAAQADFTRASIDLKRRQALASSGSVSGDELTRAQDAFTSARANLEAARAAAEQAKATRTAASGERATNEALISDATVETNPEVALARAKRDQAKVDLERTEVRAPVDGVVAKRTVQLGQRVQAGEPLLAVVPVQDMHVDANFKEVQLSDVTVGQHATLEADLYGGKVTYHGVVEGLSGGSGSAFAAIPAQNATGNWIKVVQRLPVRIKLDPAELAKHPLKVGLSMNVEINTKQP